MDTLSKLNSQILSGEAWTEALTDPLGEMGFDNASKAWGLLSTLRQQANFPDHYPTFFPSLLDSLDNCYDPDLALNNFERLSEVILDKEHLYSVLTQTPELLKALVILFSGSQVLTDTLLSNPSHFDWLNQPDTLSTPTTKDGLYRNFDAMAKTTPGTASTYSLLRGFKKREYIRIGLRDLMGAVTMQETVEDLSDLADVCLQIAYEDAYEVLANKHGIPLYKDAKGEMKESEFTILAMGKLGGRELNYSSDIDLIYIYSSAYGETVSRSSSPATGPSISNYEFQILLGQRITKMVNEITGEGNVFRVDLNLRPEGQSGEIAHSLSFCEDYYQSAGRTWERQALIKARVSAGSEDLGREFFKMIQPFVYRKTLDFQAIEEVKALKRKIDHNLRIKKQEKGHIKLGYGGIREIEFIIQSYQLMFGGRDRLLQDTGSLSTLKKLYEREFLTDEEYQKLNDAYIFLRNLENRVQMVFGRQTYHLPKEVRGMAVLARKMGIQGKSHETLAKQLDVEFERHTSFVGNMFDQLFKEDKDQQAADDTSRKWDARQDADDWFSEDLLKTYPFDDPKRTFSFLKSLRDGPQSRPTREKGIQSFYRVLPQILEQCLQVPNPNTAVVNLVKFLEASQAREPYLQLLDQNAKFLELLLILFGGSDALSAILIQRPNLIDVLSNVESLYRFKNSQKLKAELNECLGKQATLEDKNLELRRFKQGEELRIGIRYLIHETDLPGTLLDLSNLADLYLQSILELANDSIHPASTAAGESGNFAIFALGKLGGQELNFGSDLDIVFVYQDTGPHSAISHYSTLAQKIFQLSTEPSAVVQPYKIDTDLRPEGSRGALVMDLAGYKDYFETRGRIWEQQAMTRARFVAGNPELGKQFLETVHNFTYQPKLEYGSLIEISRLRERMEKELAQESQKGKNVKLGYGGLADIEFAVQILQLMHGHRNTKLRSTNTLDVIRILSSHGILEHTQMDRLQENYLFLRNLECAMRLVNPNAGQHLPKDETSLAVLARLMDFPGATFSQQAQSLITAYEKTTREVREFYSSNLDTLLRTSL